MNKVIFLLLLTFGVYLRGVGQEVVNDKLIYTLKKHGLEQSEVMDIASWITDIYGPRLTGSPMLDQATNWVVSTLEKWGMENVHLEEWGPFGRGWELNHFEIHAKSPNYFPIIAYPKAWSSSSPGAVSGEVIYLDVHNKEDLYTYKGKLGGKFVLLDTIRNTKEWFKPPAYRYDAKGLLKLANAPQPTPNRNINFGSSNWSFSQTLWKIMEEEKVLAVLDRSIKGDLGTVFLSGARTSNGWAWREKSSVVPQVTMGVEYYNRLLRMLDKGITPTLSMDLRARYTNPDGMEHNIIAEIPGTDLKDEVVIFGAHFDSWHAGTGATDNGAGSAVMLEVARILLRTIKETEIQPRRTLRLALWTGEEQGLFGSRAYVANHYAEVKGYNNVQAIKPAQEKVAAYYNLDNGTGKIRGVYLQGNSAVAPIFRSWLLPFQELGAETLTLSNTGGTDHLSFDAVGIPGFQFIQDPIAYHNRTHHSNMDHWDHLVEDDLKQAATIIASFVMHTALRDEKLPRKTLSN